MYTDSSDAPDGMRRVRRWLRAVLRFFLVVIVFVFLLIALISALLAFGSPYIGRYHAEIQARVSDYLGAPVAFGDMHLDWSLGGPRIEIDDVSVLAASTSEESIVRFDQIWIDLSLTKTLLTGGWHFNQLAVVGADFEIEYRGEKDIQIKGIDQIERNNSGQNKRSQPASLSGQTSLAWLFRVSNAALLESAVTVVDVPRNKTYRFESIDIEAENDGDRHLLTADVVLPDSLGESLELTADIDLRLQGRRVNFKQAAGNVVLEGNRVDVESWLDFLPQQQLQLSGNADMRLVGEWQGSKVNKVDLELNSPTINAQSSNDSAEEIELDDLSARLRWTRTDQGWVSDVDKLQFTYLDTVTDMRDGEFRVRHADADENHDLDTRVWQAKLSGNQVDISALSLISVHVATLFPMGTFPSVLIDAQPGGLLTDWQFNVDRGMNSNRTDGLPLVSVYGELSNLSLSQSGSLPEISGLNARLQINDNVGTVDLQGNDFSFRHAEIFPEPLELESLQASFDVVYSDDSRTIATDNLTINDDGLSARLIAAVDVSDHAAPQVDVSASYSLDDVTKVYRYLPRGKLRPRLTKWLDQSIKGGSATDGFLKLKGNPRNFPFHKNPGVFAATLKLSNAELDFLSDWPTMNRVDGSLTFSKNALVFELDKGRFGSLPLRSGTGTIESLFQPVVRVSAATRDSVDNLVAIVGQSPLKQVQKAIADTVGNGEADAHIELQVPLRRESDRGPDEFFDVSGYVQFDKNILSSETYRTQLEQVVGRLGFTHTGVKRSTLRGRYNGRPVVVVAQSAGQDSSRRTEMTVTGRADSAEIAKQNRIPLVSGLRGVSSWKVEVDVPHDAERLQRNGVSLAISSDLEGTALNWPAPLGKSSSSTLPLHIATRFGSDRASDWFIRLGDRAQSVLRLKEGEPGLESLTLNVGDGSATLDDQQQGIRILGTTDTIAFDQWFDAIRTLIAEVGDLSDDTSDNPLPRISADLSAKRLTTGSSSHGRASLRINSDNDFINAALGNQRIRGSVRIPRNEGVVQLRIDNADIDLLRELQTKNQDTASEPVDPREVPALDVRLGRFQWGELTLKNLVVRTEPDRAGMKIKTIGFAEDSAQLTGDGFWHWQDPQNVNPALAGQQVTGLDLQVRSNDVGDALEKLGFSEALAEGRGTIDMIVGWRGPLFQPQLDNLDGSIEFDLRDGRILSVDPGIARFLGLFALQSIPRRLSLDFNDFVRDGLEYTTIGGRISLQDGLATSELVQLRGPVGVVDVTGASNIAARTYDQTITVLPRISGALPLIGIVAGGATAGIGGLLAGPVLKAFGIDFDQIGLSVFTLTGSWDNPVIQQEDISSIYDSAEFERR